MQPEKDDGKRIHINNDTKPFSARKWKLEREENAKAFREAVLDAMNEYDTRVVKTKGL